MKRQKKQIASAAMAVCLAASLTGCGMGGDEKEGTPGAPHIGIIFTQAGLGGNSFNDLALEGVKQAAEDFGITFDQVEPKSVADEEIIQDEMASSEEYDLIICVGDEQVDALENVASVYTDQKFALLDATSDLENVASYSCKAQEGSFMVGALAALASEGKIDEKLSGSDTVGFIGGVDNPLINQFAAGYKAGAEYVDADINVLIDYAGGFNDPTTAKTIANTFTERGAEVIFHAAGASGMGVFQAAQEKGFVAIGVNLNQNGIAPDYIMASMLKKLDTCAYKAIASVVDDTYTGENQLLGLSDGGVDYTVEGSNIQVPDEIIEELDEIKEGIVSGEIEVPSELD
ncbi:MAG TPA: BMP family ABC transporter substrate-binding protein [Candidatus Blautia faecipullorum]|nr:BMP family ABC transporter substrate-binding protein [Candidatus Blautia faecipullorum]